MKMNRIEHLNWCKERAREYISLGKPADAIASMLSDLSKHPETKQIGEATGMIGIFSSKSLDEASKFIEGFN